MIDCAQGRTRRKNHWQTQVPHQIYHSFIFIDGNQNAAGAFYDQGTITIHRRQANILQ